MSTFFEWFTSYLTPGASAWVKRSHLEVATDRAFKLVRIHYDVCAHMGPSLLVIRGYGPLSRTSSISNTEPFLVGLSPRRGTLAVNSPWFQVDTNGEAPIVAVDNICVSKEAKQQHGVYLSIRMEFLLSPETVSAACPKLMHVEESSRDE